LRFITVPLPGAHPASYHLKPTAGNHEVHVTLLHQLEGTCCRPFKEVRRILACAWKITFKCMQWGFKLQLWYFQMC